MEQYFATKQKKTKDKAVNNTPVADTGEVCSIEHCVHCGTLAVVIRK